MSHLSDEDDEFLYGSDSEKKSNPLLDNKTDVDGLYDLYEDNEAKDSEQKEEAPEAEKSAQSGADQDTNITEAEPTVEVGADEVNEQEEEEDSDDDLEIILEPEDEPPQETEAEAKEGEQAATTEEKDTPVNIKPGQQGKPSSAPTDNTSSKANAAGTKSQGGINLELIGEYNGQPITDVDLDDVEDKPWRKPGADITDYFNYGFNEVSWRSYCAKQKMLRENKKMMGDMDMGDFMSMGMMMPPNLMDGSMPMMPNPMMGLPMGMPPPPQAPGNPAMRNNRNGNFNARGSGRNVPMGRSKNAEGKEGGNEVMNPMDGEMPMNEGGMFPMEFPGGPGGMPMNMFPPDMPGGPMGMPFFNPNMPGVPMGFDSGDFRGGNNSGRQSMRSGGNMSGGGGGGGRSQAPHSSSGRSSSNYNSSSHNSSSHSSSHNSGSGGHSSSYRGRDDSSSDHRSDSRKRNNYGSSNDRDSSSHQDDYHNKRSRNR